MEETPLVSVIVLAYNNQEYIRYALDSILAQDYPAMEVIVADDHSRAFDCEGIRAYLESRRGANIRRVLVYQNPENYGTVKNFNCAIAKAQGTYLKGLAADDALYAPDVLTRGCQALAQSPDGVMAAYVMQCTADMKEIGLLREGFLRALPQKTPRELWKVLCVHNGIAAPGVFFARTFFQRYGAFDESYRILEDWPTWLRVTRQGCRISCGDFVAVKYRGNTGSATSVSPVYLADKRRTFEQEIRPYRSEMEWGVYCKALLNWKIRDSILVRKIYGMLFRR